MILNNGDQVPNAAVYVHTDSKVEIGFATNDNVLYPYDVMYHVVSHAILFVVALILDCIHACVASDAFLIISVYLG